MLKAPAEDFPVSAGEKKARAGDALGCADESHQRGIRKSDAMAEVAEVGGVSDDPAIMHHDRSGLLINGGTKFRLAIVPVHAAANYVCILQIGGGRAADIIAA